MDKTRTRRENKKGGKGRITPRRLVLAYSSRSSAACQRGSRSAGLWPRRPCRWCPWCCGLCCGMRPLMLLVLLQTRGKGIGRERNSQAFCRNTVLSANTLLWCQVMRYPRSFNLTSLFLTLFLILGTPTSASPPSASGTATIILPLPRALRPPSTSTVSSSSSPSKKRLPCADGGTSPGSPLCRQCRG